MPLDALPPHLQDIENNFKDDDQFIQVPIVGLLYRWFQKKTKGWTAFSYKGASKYSWANWREVPLCLAFFGGPFLRVESSDGKSKRIAVKQGQSILIESNVNPKIYYVSRIQLWCRWHIQLQWPLFFAFHWYTRSSYVPKFREDIDTDGKLWFFYIGAKRDPDCYWFPSLYLGRNFK